MESASRHRAHPAPPCPRACRNGFQVARSKRIAQGGNTGEEALLVGELLSPEEETERKALLDEGFPAWNRTDFNRFIRAAERYGRNDVEKMAKEVRSPRRVRLQHQERWSRRLPTRGSRARPYSA